MKALEDIAVPDDRQNFFLGGLDDLHADPAAIEVHESVPAKLTGSLALEAGLRSRASQESQTLAKKRLRSVMRQAVSAGCLSEERITDCREIARARVAQRKAMQAIDIAKLADSPCLLKSQGRQRFSQNPAG